MSQFLFSHFVSELPIYINISKLRHIHSLAQNLYVFTLRSTSQSRLKQSISDLGFWNENESYKKNSVYGHYCLNQSAFYLWGKDP